MLSILIPTYNRSEFLLRNLNILETIINEGNFGSLVSIIISDNKSPDDTVAVVTNFIENTKVSINLHQQTENLGVKKNVLFVLDKSESEYVMFLGDDDYISFNYLNECLKILQTDPETAAIIPNYYPVTVDLKKIAEPREPETQTTSCDKGFPAALQNCWKGHQLSGLVFKRKGLSEEYKHRQVDNLYFFIFFMGLSSLNGKTYTISRFPVKVTQPVKAKEWGYGKDGLMNEIFDNYKKLRVNYLQRFLLERRHFNIQNWRLFMYKREGLLQFIRSFFLIGFCKNSTLLFRLLFPYLVYNNRKGAQHFSFGK